MVLLLLIGSWLVSRGDATPGDLVLAAVVFGLLATPLRVFGFFLEEMRALSLRWIAPTR